MADNKAKEVSGKEVARSFKDSKILKITPIFTLSEMEMH